MMCDRTGDKLCIIIIFWTWITMLSYQRVLSFITNKSTWFWLYLIQIMFHISNFYWLKRNKNLTIIFQYIKLVIECVLSTDTNTAFFPLHTNPQVFSQEADQARRWDKSKESQSIKDRSRRKRRRKFHLKSWMKDFQANRRRVSSM